MIKIFGFEIFSKNEMIEIRQGILAQSRSGFAEMDKTIRLIKSVQLENMRLADQNRKLLQQLACLSVLGPQPDD